MPFKPTQSQNLILQFLFSTAISAAIGAINAGSQYVLQGGKINIGVLVSISLATFAFAFGNALKIYIPSHIKDVLQAKDDTIAQLRTQLATQQTLPAPVLQQAPAQQQPVIVNITPTTPMQASVQPAPVSTPSQQFMQPVPSLIVPSAAPVTVNNPFDGMDLTNTSVQVVKP